MSGDSQTSSPVVRFLDSFLQEKNIKWLLGVGTLIVLGSSFRLVATHWNEYPPIWKYLVFIAYTSVIFAAGEEMSRRAWVSRAVGSASWPALRA